MNILDSIAVRLPCRRCGEEYEVPLRDIVLSHAMLHEGCPVLEESECPPLAQSKLIGLGPLEDLQYIWDRLEESARAAGGRLVLHSSSMADSSKESP